jgi:replicative DNA helicase
MIDLQKIVIGHMLISSNAYDTQFHNLKPSYFTDPLCKAIYNCGVNLKKKNMRLDLLTASQNLKNNEIVEQAGGITAILDLTKHIGGDVNLERDIALLAQEYLRSQMFALTSQAHIEAADKINDPILTINRLIDQLEELTEIGLGKSKSNDVKQLTSELKQHLQEKAKAYHSGEPMGIPTGIVKMDDETGGWQKGETVVLGARPKIGKTALVLFHAKAAAKAGFKTAIFTLEISAKAVTTRLMTGMADGRINPLRIRKGNLTPDDFDAITLAQSYLDELPITISDTCRTISAIKTECRRLKKDNKLDFVIIDFIQKFQSETRYPSREREVSAIIDEITFMGIELDVAILAISRVNRSVEQRPDKKASISDLQDAGTIESNADMIILPFRMGAYDPNDTSMLMEYVVAANRNGGLFAIDLYHDKYMTNFFEHKPYVAVPAMQPSQSWFEPNAQF